MITRSLVGCLFRLEHPKGGGRDGKQGSLFISKLLPLIYIRLDSSVYMYSIIIIIMILPNLCMRERSGL
jgi:hypothetical protein